MANYIGLTCPVCNRKFEKGDDVVVCPDCGTPHHRECWAKIGHCANEMRHGEHYVFEVPKVNPVPQQKEGANICPYCGAENPDGAIFCVRCGKDIVTRTTQNSTINPMGASQDFSVYGGAYPEEEIDGVSAQDMVNFIGKSSGYYLYQFKNMQRNKRKISFSFSGFFITPIYMFYRKMWGWGVISVLLNILLSMPAAIVNYLSIFNETGFNQLIDRFGANPINIVLTVFTLLNMLYSIFFGMYANYIYKQHVVKKIKKIKGQNLPYAEEVAVLHKKGGVSYAVMIVLLVFLVISSSLQFYSALL